MASKSKKNFLVQGSVLAAAGILVRIIGLIYRIPLTNIIGTEGMGVYGTAFSVYDILLLISSYSLPTAVSRLIARELALSRYRNSRVIFMGACIFALISGGIMAAFTWFGANFLVGLLEMPRAALALKTLAPTIFMMAFLGVLRGYFQGHGTMIPTALSQVFEQIVNAAVSILAAYFLFKRGAALDAAAGLAGYNAPAYGAAGGTIGTGAGAATALIFCIIVFILYKPVMMKKVNRDRSTRIYGYPYALKILVFTIVPILLSTTIYQLNSIIGQLIYAQYYGEGYESIWGSFTGQYQLLIHVPTAIAAAIGASIIPSLTTAVEHRDYDDARDKMSSAIRFNMVIAIPATVGLAVLAAPILGMLFRSTDTTLAVQMMLIGSTAVVFTALSTIMNSILQGIGRIWVPVRNALISEVLHIGFLALMLWVFDIGIFAVVLANILFYISMGVLNYLSLRTIIGYRQEYQKTFLMPLAAAAVMGAVIFLCNFLLQKFTGSNTLSAIVSIIVAVAVYAVMLLLIRGLEEEDLLRFPGGRKIAAFAAKLHLLRG